MPILGWFECPPVHVAPLPKSSVNRGIKHVTDNAGSCAHQASVRRGEILTKARYVRATGHAYWPITASRAWATIDTMTWENVLFRYTSGL